MTLTIKEEIENYKQSYKGAKKALQCAKKNKCDKTTISLLEKRVESNKRTYQNLRKRSR